MVTLFCDLDYLLLPPLPLFPREPLFELPDPEDLELELEPDLEGGGLYDGADDLEELGGEYEGEEFLSLPRDEPEFDEALSRLPELLRVLVASLFLDELVDVLFLELTLSFEPEPLEFDEPFDKVPPLLLLLLPTLILFKSTSRLRPFLSYDETEPLLFRVPPFLVLLMYPLRPRSPVLSLKCV